MYLEYPDYYNRFRCIGGSCKDTCCAGWEVDVDEESFYYYQTIPGEFGERLRKHLKEDGEDKYFPLTKARRCPFLNQENLCDIYTELGEDALCQVCTEYPRYFMEAGSYQQMDMSLSCMELGRIFFCEEGRIEYLRSQDEFEGQEISSEDEERLAELLALRNDCIAFLQDAIFPENGEELPELSFLTLLSKLMSELSLPEDFIEKAVKDLPERFQKLEVLDGRWTEFTEELKKQTGGEKEKLLSLCQDFRTAFSGDYDRTFGKIAVYLIFRYFIDAFYEDSIEDILRLLLRGLLTVELIAAVRFREKGSFDMEDMIDAAHLFSKEVEHAEENIAIFKGE